jgi:predicted nuclease of restriction endonuclease-like (RecB) superfamily
MAQEGVLMIYSPISEDMLREYQSVLPTLTSWDKSKQSEIWSKERIDGELMYKFHRTSARIVEETGLQIQSYLYEKYGKEKKLFPHNFQIIKISNTLKSCEIIEPIKYQTVTFLNGEFVNKTIEADKDNYFEYNLNEITYAFGVLWSNEINLDVPKWFRRPYHRMSYE